MGGTEGLFTVVIPRKEFAASTSKAPSSIIVQVKGAYDLVPKGNRGICLFRKLVVDLPNSLIRRLVQFIRETGLKNHTNSLSTNNTHPHEPRVPLTRSIPQENATPNGTVIVLSKLDQGFPLKHVRKGKMNEGATPKSAAINPECDFRRQSGSNQPYTSQPLSMPLRPTAHHAYELVPR